MKCCFKKCAMGNTWFTYVDTFSFYEAQKNVQKAKKRRKNKEEKYYFKCKKKMKKNHEEH